MIIIHIIESSNARKQIIDLKKGVLYRKKSSIKIPKAIPLRIKRVKKEVTHEELKNPLYSHIAMAFQIEERRLIPAKALT